MRSIRLGTLLTLCAAAALAQQRTEPLPTFSERVEVRVLDLDVDVTDKKGQSVPDLKKEEFTVKIGGKVYPIDYFARVDQGTIHAPDLATASPDQVLAAYKTGNEAFVPRNFLIYVDLGFLPPGLRNRSLEAIRDLVTRLGPQDAARVVVFNRIPKVLVDWTTSKEAIFSALSSIEREGVGMSRLQAERETMVLIDSTPRRRQGRAPIIQQYAQEVGSEIQTMLESMKQELVTLTPLNGKKAFLFVSGGFEFQPGYVMAQYATGGIGPATLSTLNVRDISQYADAAIRRANGDEITFYTVDASGLTPEGEPASGGETVGTRQGASFDPFGTRPSVAFIARQDRQNGLQLLARETGGIALLNTNDFDRGLSRVYQAVSTYYTVGVNLSSLPTAKYEEVRVEVNRPDVTVRARRGFEARPETDIIRDRALATMETDLSYSAIPVQLQTKPATPDKKLYVLPVTVLVPASALTFAPEGDKASARAEFYIGSVDDKGGRSEVSRQEGSFQIPAGEVKGSAMLRFEAQLQTKKGNFRLVVNVRDAASGKMGTARANVRVE
jgi:VWFA-related protein